MFDYWVYPLSLSGGLGANLSEPTKFFLTLPANLLIFSLMVAAKPLGEGSRDQKAFPQAADLAPDLKLASNLKYEVQVNG